MKPILVLCVLLLALTTPTIGSVDEDDGGSDLAIDIPAEAPVPTQPNLPSTDASPLVIPCDILVGGSHIKFESLKDNIVRLLKDVSQPSNPERRVFVCPPEALRELRSYIRSFGPMAFLTSAQTELRSVAMNGFSRLGDACAVDLMTLSDTLHQWEIEIETLSSAVAHADEDCPQAWAHFLAFIERSEQLSPPSFRSENCTFTDEYRACFDVKPM